MQVLGSAAAGATARAAIQVADGSSVDRNAATLLGALAAGGDGSLAIQLASANITNNALRGGLLVALGGAGSSEASGAAARGVALQGNTDELRVEVTANNSVVTSTLDIVLGLGEPRAGRASPRARVLRGSACWCKRLKGAGRWRPHNSAPHRRPTRHPRPPCLHRPGPNAAFNQSGLDLPASLRGLQRDACAALASATTNGTAAAAAGGTADARLPGELAAVLEQVGGPGRGGALPQRWC